MLKIGISVILGNKFPFKEMKMHTEGGRATDAPHSEDTRQQRLFSFSSSPTTPQWHYNNNKFS